MDPEHRDILITRRVELVEDIDIQGGLFTQLISRKVLLRRDVNRIRLNRTPEEQVEELLNELPKRVCFDTFCEALIADGQEHIVEKYLKTSPPAATQQQTTKSALEATAASQKSAECSPAPAPTRPSVEESLAESTDSVASNQAGLKRALSPNPSSTAVICIREEDNKHVYIRYTDERATPEKRQRALEAGTSVMPVVFEPDETRYAMKHYVSQETGQPGEKGLILHQAAGGNNNSLVVLKNPQALGQNPNITDPLRYSSAFPVQQQLGVPAAASVLSHHSVTQLGMTNPGSPSLLSTGQYQQAGIINLHPQATVSSGIQLAAAAAPPSSLSAPFKDPSSLVNQQEAETAHLQSLLQPQPGQAFFNVDHLKGSNAGSFVRLNQGAAAHQFQDPQQYLKAAGLLPSAKGLNSSITQSSHLDPVSARSPMLSRYDSVDKVTLSSPAKSIHLNLAEHGLNMSTITDFTADSLEATLQEKSLEASYFGSNVNNSVSVGGDGTSDLDQIDLPDGCVNVKVEHCTRQFFLANHKQAYPMRRIPRGLALIINVDEVEGKPPRKGTNFDRDNLCNLLCQLHFNIIVYNDKDGLSAQEMVNKLKEFAKLPEHAEMDACFVCLLSHGEEGYIFGTDGKRIPLEEIFMLFGNTNCKGLWKKPKVFIIQACRGGYLDRGVRMDEPDGGSVAPGAPPSRASSGKEQLPSMSDMLVCYPTLAGYYAWRNRARGSWYIEAIVQVFMRYAKCEDVCAMLNRVNQLVSKKVSECNQKEMNAMSQMSEYKSSLRQAHLYLFPGIGICMKPQQ